MARGHDLLFDPPVLFKKNKGVKQFLLGEEKVTAFPLREATLLDSHPLFLQERDDGKLSLLHSLPSKSRGILRQNIFASGQVSGFGPEGYLTIKESDDLIVYRPDGKKEIYSWDMPGEPLYLHATPEVIYVLWRDEADLAAIGHATIRLSAVYRDDTFEWQEIFSYSRGSLRVEDRGHKSFLIYDEDSEDGDIVSLMTLSDDGPGDVYPLGADEAAAIRRDLYAYRSAGERMLTPGREDGQYYYLDITDDHATLNFIDLQKRIRDKVAYLAKDAQELEAFLDSQDVLRLRSSGDYLALLLPGQLQIFAQGRGLIEKISLPRDYNEIDFSDNKITLFCSGEKDYRQITLP